MSVADIPIQLEVPGRTAGRSRSNSTSQVVAMPHPKAKAAHPHKRQLVQYYVTLLPLNDTFTKKHLPVAVYPQTTKLGRPTGTRHKPDVTNGYFDLRVLSRNHAQIYIDGASGKLMLQDLGSSNGTYLNDFRLGADPVEIKIGDLVCLGFNVQLELTHKQISLRVDNILMVRNDYQLSLFANTLHLKLPQFKHLSFIEDIYKRAVNGSDEPRPRDNTNLDAALFGDVNPAIEDELLGLFSSANAGIYTNLAITNALTFELMVNSLVGSLAKIKQQNHALHSLNDFLTNYHTRLDELNTSYLDTQLQKTVDRMEEELHQEKLSNEQIKHHYQQQHSEAELRIAALADQVKALEDECMRQNMLLTAAPAAAAVAAPAPASPLPLLLPNGLFRFNGEFKDKDDETVERTLPLPLLHLDLSDLQEFFNQPPPPPPCLSKGCKRLLSGEISPVLSKDPPEKFPTKNHEELADPPMVPPLPLALVAKALSPEEAQNRAQTVVIAMGALMLGYLIQRITN